ncbi:PKD domain-containing protein, partial [Hymenobacter sp. BT175]|uniref:PKD domain-containing protein n=1 Tax=Hymenobacter translucens TaxID=2886507 RepID=UPI001D0DDACE
GVSQQGSRYVFTPPATPGSYALTYATTNGACFGSAQRRFTVLPTPTPAATLTNAVCPALPSVNGIAPYQAQFQNSSLNAVQFSWDFGDGTTSSEQNPTHLYQQPGTYAVRLTAANSLGCPVSSLVSTVTVVQALVPNIITPNGDGLNDTFQQRFSCLPTELSVYSRWGQRVFYRADYHNDWDAK